MRGVVGALVVMLLVLLMATTFSFARSEDGRTNSTSVNGADSMRVRDVNDEALGAAGRPEFGSRNESWLELQKWLMYAYSAYCTEVKYRRRMMWL